MAILTWFLLMLFAQQTYCHSTSKHKSHHHTNAKKSFLADAMKEMDGEDAPAVTANESGQNNTKSAAAREDNHHHNKTQEQKHANKNNMQQDNFVARIFPSRVIAEVSQNQHDKVDKSKKNDNETPKIGTTHSTLYTSEDETKGKNKDESVSKVEQVGSLHQNSSTSTIAPSSSLQLLPVSSTITTSITIASSNRSKSVSEKKIGIKSEKKKGHQKNIKDTIRLLQAFVEKLLKENETSQSHNSSHAGSHPKPTMRQPEKKDVLKEALPIHVHPDDGQQSTVISGIKYNLAPVYRIKAKYAKDAGNVSNTSNSSSEQQQQQQEPQGKLQLKQQQQLQQNNTQNTSQGDIEKLKQEENLLRQSLAQKELEIQKLKQQSPPSVNNVNASTEPTAQTPNITNESIKQDESPANDDQKEMKFASLKGVPPELLMKLKTILEEKKRKSLNAVSKQEVHSRKAFETARKLVKAALAREQLYNAEQDFFEKVKEMMNKTSTANLVQENSDAQKEGTVNNDEGSTIKDYIQQIEEQSRLESKVRRTSPSPLQSSTASNTTTPRVNDSISATKGLQGINDSSAVSQSDLQASAAKILKELNRTKGPEEKNVEAAAHLEERVAEQQDEMYEKLIRQTLGKGMGGDDEDDEEEDEEEGATRNVNDENRPQEEMGRQENYGDFQDSDEDAQSRSDIKYVKTFNQNETLPTIDEDSLLSLRDRISRPPKQRNP